MAVERAHPLNPDFGKDTKYGGYLRQRYKFCEPYVQDKRVLDIPCGTGYGSALLKGYRFLKGIDISREAIDFANKHYYVPEFRHFSVGSMMNIPELREDFDVVICLDGLEHITKEDALEFLKEVKGVLIVGGHFILTVPVLKDDKPSGNPFHLYEYPEKELWQILNCYFRFIYIERYQTDIPMYRIVLQKDEV